MQIDQVINTSLHDNTFTRFLAAFTDRRVRTWSTLEEKALLFGLARHHTPNGVIVELGSYCGGSAAFFAMGLASKPDSGSGRVVCVDPLLGAPPWFALPPEMYTLSELQNNLTALGLHERIDIKVGDSAALGAVWPAEPIDVLLIDGDHSFEGALRDLECWLPKLRNGGIMLFDDIDNIPEMKTADDLLGMMRTVTKLGAVGGMGVYQIGEGGWRLVEELRDLLSDGRIHRPWNYLPVHARQLPSSFRRTREWDDHAFNITYDVAFLGVCETGDYGAVAGSPRPLVQVAQSVHADRGGGEFIMLADMGRHGRTFRLVVCKCDDIGRASRLLLPGGVLLACQGVMSEQSSNATLKAIRAAGLDGAGHSGGDQPIFWGVSDCAGLSAVRVVEGLMAINGHANN